MLEDQLHAHAEIRATIAQLRAHLESETPACHRDFARSRWLLVRQVALHDRIENHWRDALRPAVVDTPCETEARGPDVAEQVIAWGTRVQDERWGRYRADALRLMARMEGRMDAEEAEFAALHARATGASLGLGEPARRFA